MDAVFLLPVIVFTVKQANRFSLKGYALEFLELHTSRRINEI